MRTTHRSLCRFCHAHCAVKVEVEDGRIAKVIGDKDDPLYAGFSCAKGREVPRQMEHAERLLHSQRRRADGTHEPIASAQAIREIAEKVQRILDRDGPRAIAAYTGTYSFPYPPTQESQATPRPSSTRPPRTGSRLPRHRRCSATPTSPRSGSRSPSSSRPLNT